jgi:hypothetical protein
MDLETLVSSCLNHLTRLTAGEDFIILGTRYISKNTKIRIYKTVIRPVVLYGSETCAITGKMASSLMTRERKILRKIYGPKCEQGVWRIRVNLELAKRVPVTRHRNGDKSGDWNGWDISSEWMEPAWLKRCSSQNPKLDVILYWKTEIEMAG